MRAPGDAISLPLPTEASAQNIQHGNSAQTPPKNSPAAARDLLQRSGPSGLSLHVNLPVQKSTLFNRDALRDHVARHHRRFAQIHPLRGIHVPIQLALNHHRLGADVGLNISVRSNRQAVIAQLNLAFNIASTYKSSEPDSSPLMTTDLPMWANS